MMVAKRSLTPANPHHVKMNGVSIPYIHLPYRWRSLVYLGLGRATTFHWSTHKATQKPRPIFHTLKYVSLKNLRAHNLVMKGGQIAINRL